MHSLLHDIPRFFILFLEELFLIFNQMLSIRAFGRRVTDNLAYHQGLHCLLRSQIKILIYRKTSDP